MKLSSFKDLFDVLVADVHCIEEQSTRLLPILAQKAKSTELKKALQNHLEETREQLQRIKSVCSHCKGETAKGYLEWENPLKSIFDNAEKFVNENTPSALLDAAIIAIVQKIEHLEIAAYGTLAEYSKLIDDADVKDMVKQSLKEEKKADTLLNRLAKGGFFASGINVEASKGY